MWDGGNPIHTTLNQWLKPLLVGVCRGIIIAGFLNDGAKSISQPSTVCQSHSSRNMLRSSLLRPISSELRALWNPCFWRVTLKINCQKKRVFSHGNHAFPFCWRGFPVKSTKKSLFSPQFPRKKSGAFDAFCWPFGSQLLGMDHVWDVLRNPRPPVAGGRPCFFWERRLESP